MSKPSELAKALARDPFCPRELTAEDIQAILDRAEAMRSRYLDAPWNIEGYEPEGDPDV